MSEKKPPLRLVLIFIFYILFMIWLLFFFNRRPYFSELSYLDTIGENINTTPFSTIGRYINAIKNGRLVSVALVNLIGNILIFIPLGMLLPSLWKILDTPVRILISCGGLILMVEITQLFTLRGSYDVDDIILNLSGCIIGYIIHRLIAVSHTSSSS